MCEELCGIGHFVMRGAVVRTQAEYDAWLDAQPTFAETQRKLRLTPLPAKHSMPSCAACHGAQGEGNQALNGPKTGRPASLVHRKTVEVFQSRRTRR